MLLGKGEHNMDSAHVGYTQNAITERARPGNAAIVRVLNRGIRSHKRDNYSLNEESRQTSSQRIPPAPIGWIFSLVYCMHLNMDEFCWRISSLSVMGKAIYKGQQDSGTSA
jgi:hypothetical protein